MTNPFWLTFSAILLTLEGEAPITIWSGLFVDIFNNFADIFNNIMEWLIW